MVEGRVIVFVMKKVAIGFILTLDIVRRATLIANIDYLLDFFVALNMPLCLISKVNLMIFEVLFHHFYIISFNKY